VVRLIQPRRLILNVIILGCLLLAQPGGLPVALAQATPQTPYSYTFGQTLIVSLLLPTGQWGSEAKLYLRTAEHTQLHQLPVANNQARYERDLRQELFAPFAQVTYWWEYTDAQGQTYRTEEISFLYEDNRFAWQELRRDNLTLRWVSGEPALMLNGLDIAQASLEEIQNALGSPVLSEPLALYVYPSQPDLQSALRLAGREWVGGEAYPAVGVVLLAIPPSSQATLQMELTIPHELTHYVLYQLLGAEGYEGLPTWLNEGLASYFERRPDPTYAVALEKARREATLLPLGQLCNTLPLEQSQIILAYAQSQSVATYLRQTYGWSGLRTLLNAYADGAGCSAGLERSLNIDLATLEREWRVWLEHNDQAISRPQRAWLAALVVVQDLAPWLLLIGLLFLPALVATRSVRSNAR